MLSVYGGIDGLRCGSGSGMEGVGCVWGGIVAVDVVEGRVKLVGVELAREWSWVGWRQGVYGG